MGLFDELKKIIDPHAEKLNRTLSLHGTAMTSRMGAIERAVSDLARGDIGNKWQRFQIKRKFLAAEDFEVGICPINEIWLIQAISSDGVQEKSPAYVILANGILIESVIKEGLGFEGIGGNQILLPGERLSITLREEGSINCVITLIRRPLPVPPKPVQMGQDTDRFSPKSNHDPARDLIASRTAQFTEQQAEVAATEGRTG